MIKTSIEIPVFSKEDLQDADKLFSILTTFKQYCEELARLAQSIQMEVRTTVPSASEMEEGEQVRVTSGGNNYIYTKKDGVVRYWQLT